MEVILINLDRAIQRMSFQQKQLTQLGITFTRMSANGASHRVYYEKYRGEWERPLSYAEVSCYLNHKTIWTLVAAGHEPVLILEDDAYLAQGSAEILNEIEKLENLDYLNIEARGNNQKKLVEKKPTFFITNGELFELFQGRSGTAGYVLWPRGAKKLLTQNQQGYVALADKFINANYSLLAYQLEPAILIQLDRCEHYGIKAPINTTSSISAGTKQRPTFIKYWVYKLRRLNGQFRIGTNYLMHFYHAHKRAIAISDNFKNLNRSCQINPRAANDTATPSPITK
ncbi:MAG: glycosyl transferase family 25 [Paraglaciecola sp.]|jgi:glycosyl transferase family 25